MSELHKFKGKKAGDALERLLITHHNKIGWGSDDDREFSLNIISMEKADITKQVEKSEKVNPCEEYEPLPPVEGEPPIAIDPPVECGGYIVNDGWLYSPRKRELRRG